MPRTRWHASPFSRGAALAAVGMLVIPSIAAGAALSGAGSIRALSAPTLAASGQRQPFALSYGTPRAHSGHATVMPFRGLEHGQVRSAQLSAAAHASVGQRSPLTQSQPPLAGLFNGLNKPGLNDPNVTPPDTTGAIGPNHYVEAVNQQVGAYDRNLNLLSQTDMGSFTGASPLDLVSDPQMQWDGQAGRWLYAAVAVAQGDNALLFGWSKNADPSDLVNGWCRFGIGRGSDLDDYPKLGHDNNFILVGSNVYTDTVPNYHFETATLWAVPKPALGDTSCTGPLVAYYFGSPSSPLLNQDGTPAYTPVPANTADASGSGYVVAAHTPVSGDGAPLGPQTKLMVWHVTSGAGVPSLVADGDQAVPTFDKPDPAPQPGSSNTIDTLDGRLTQAVAVNDPGAGGAKGIWTQHTVAGPGGRSVVRWYELIGGAPVTIRQQGQVDSAADYVFNAAISPAIGGDSAAIFYNRSSTSLLPVIAGLSRGPSTTLGTMDPGELLLGSSSAVDTDPSCAPCRWGDYSGATPDPANQGVVWGSNQVTGPCFVLCGFFSQWQTRNFAVVAASSPPPTPPSAPTLTGATPASGQVTLSWTAPSSNGGAPVTNYTIYRGTASNGEAFLVTVGNVLSYIDAGLANGTTYFYKVAAVNSAGTGPQSNERSATPQNGDFTITATPSSQSVGRGGTVTYTVTLTPSGGFTGNVSLSASASPKAKGTTLSFSPQTLVVPSMTTSTLTVRTGRNTTRGTYTITITAIGGGLTRTTTVTLLVT
jgi:Fibronectin type III domain